MTSVADAVEERRYYYDGDIVRMLDSGDNFGAVEIRDDTNFVRFKGNWSEYSLNGTAYLDRPGCYEFSAYVDRAKDGGIVLYPHEGFRWVGNRPTSSSKCKTVLRPVSAATAADYAERDMTCRGPLYGSGIYNIGTCYIHNDMFSYNDVVRWCEDEKPCVVRARVVPRGTPSGMPQSYTIVKVYSARRPRR